MESQRGKRPPPKVDCGSLLSLSAHLNLIQLLVKRVVKDFTREKFYFDDACYCFRSFLARISPTAYFVDRNIVQMFSRIVVVEAKLIEREEKTEGQQTVVA